MFSNLKEYMDSRNNFVDSLRGFAVAGMLVYHMIFIFDFLKVIDFDIYGSAEMFVLGNIVRIIFFVTAGISSLFVFQKSDSNQKFFSKLWLRSLRIFEAAVIVSLGSFVLYEQYTVYFGVLHALALGTLLSGLLIRYRKLNILIILFFLTANLWMGCTDDLFPLTYVLGFSCSKLQTFDYFPLFPWMGFILSGQLFGKWVIEKTNELKPRGVVVNTFGFLGRNALRIYLWHIPGIVILVELYKIIFAK
jgi:uncharacterized membrane protein